MNDTPAKLVALTAIISVGGCLILMGLRVYYAISFTEPLQGMTRGAEFEPMFSIWSYIKGHTVYTDQTKIPYTASFYNWLSYAAYGEVVRFTSSVLSLGDAWLPTITRMTTLVGAIVGAVATYLSLFLVLKIVETPLKIIAMAFAVFLFFGPLTGFFTIATGPDIWPMTFTVAGIYTFIRHYDTKPLRAIAWVCLFAYLSWSFKQNFIYIPAVVGLYLLLRRDWKGAAFLTIVMLASGCLTLLAGGATYTRLLYFGGSHVELSSDFFFRNLMNFVVKFSPVLTTLAVGLGTVALSPEACKVVKEKCASRSLLALPFLGVFVCTIEALPTSALLHASENHYFTLAYFMVFSAVILIVWLVRNIRLSSAFYLILALGWVGNLAATGVVFAGWKGLISVRPSHDVLMAQKACLTNFKEPFFLENPYLSLPWIMPSNQPFVIHNGYHKDRKAGIEKEGGGVGGLINRGYFATVAIDDLRGAFERPPLRLYSQRPTICEGRVSGLPYRFVIFDRLLPRPKK